MSVTSGMLEPARLQDVTPPKRFMMISGYHDYRSKRRANLHFIADELAQRGTVFFLSLRYSYLSRFVEDPRHNLRAVGNRVEQHGNVSCLLWTTLVHACRLPRVLAPLERTFFDFFSERLPDSAREAITAADIIFIESGIGLIYLPLIRRIAPTVQIIYLASDALDAISQAESIKRAFRRHAHLIDSARLPSPLLRPGIPATIPCYFIPHGIEKHRFAKIGPSPYRAGTCNAVSVGSMLFDPTFFRIAGRLFPQVTFHVIGSGHQEDGPANVIYRSEMEFEATLPFLKYADFAIAPYGEGVVPYLAHTSMKLMQYGYLGLPAVCPDIVAANHPGRYGYSRESPRSIEEAIGKALAAGRFPGEDALDWEEVTERLLHPELAEEIPF